ncbi:hypothetical protein [Actinomadura macra]|uniref:hypothetical protein n=1 Tax=Actinomadura macra TaxID=46164 RepID=UPI00082F15C4|nr:hypothetical protein [Actinomadura macra]
MSFSTDPTPARPPAGVLHHPMLAVDIAGFGRCHPADHQHLRDALYRILVASLAATAVPLEHCAHEDRGDGILVILPTDVSVTPLLGCLPHHLHAELRRYNQVSAPAVQLRLRLAVNAGYLRPDSHGAGGGRELLRLFRMLDAPEFKTVLATAGADLGVITSAHLYEEIVCGTPSLIDHTAWTRSTIAAKETHATTWIWLAPTPSTGRPEPGTATTGAGHRPITIPRPRPAPRPLNRQGRTIKH